MFSGFVNYIMPDLVDAHATIKNLLDQYKRFLETTNASEEELVQRFMDRNNGREYMDAAYKFGDSVFEALKVIGKDNRFHRLLVV